MKVSVRLSRVLLPASLVLILLLAACGGNTPAATTAPTTAPTDAPAVEATEDATEAVTDATDEADATEEATNDADATEEAGSTTSSGDAPMIRIEQQNTGLRAGPGVTYARVASANSGDLLPAIGRSGTGQSLWYQLGLDDGATAWVWSTVATLLPADAEIPEVEPPPAS